MATSGTTSFDLDVNEVLQEAWERASEGMDMASGYQHRTARRSLNLLLQEWANRGVNSFTIEEISIPLVLGQAEYSIPADTIDLIDQVVRVGTGQSQSDLAISRMNVGDYAVIANKNVHGRPNRVYIHRGLGPSITLYPVPDRDTYTFNAWRIRRIQDAATGGNTLDMPSRFFPALIAGVAYMISLKIPGGQTRTQLLKAMYNEAWDLAVAGDTDRSGVQFYPTGY